METKRLVIVGEHTHELDYESNEELFDKISGLPSEIRKIVNMAKVLGANNGNPMSGGYETSLVIQNGDAAYDTAAEVFAAVQVAAGLTARCWEMSVPPRYLYVWGSGLYGAINNQGYARFCIMDDAVAFQVGSVILGVESYDRFKFTPVKSFVDSAAHLPDVATVATAYSTNNQTGMVAIPQTNVIAAPYSRLVINYQVIVNVGAGLSSADFRIPATVKSS